MKKAPLLTFLFAVLMVALLVSCADANAPLPDDDETTTDAVPSTDGGGAAVEPSLTSEMAEVTTAEEKEPEKTTYWASWEVSDVPPVVDVNATTAPMPDIEPDPNVRPDEERRYYYLVPDETLSEVNEPVKIADTETPWYITEWETQSAYVPQDVPADKQNLAFHFPKTATAEMTDMKITVDFFQEYYRLGDPVQVQITIEKKNGELLVFQSGIVNDRENAREKYLIGIVSNDDFKNPVGGIDTRYFEYKNWEYETPLFPARYNRYAYERRGYDPITQYVILSEKKAEYEEWGYNKEYRYLRYTNLFEDNVAVMQYLLRISCEDVDPSKDYAVILSLFPYLDDEELPREYLPYKYLRIPLEIVEYESVSP